MNSREIPPFAELPGGLAPLGYRNFALFWTGHAASNSGRWMELTGAVWLVYDLTGSPVLLGVLGLCRALPAIALSAIAGVVADRVDQRKLLFATQGLAMATSLSLGVLVFSGRVEFWHVYVQVAVQGGITAFDVATRQALFPRLVPRARLPEAVTLYSTGARLAALAGPAAGGIAIAQLGTSSPFLLNSAAFLVLMSTVTMLRGVVPRSATTGSSFRGDLTDGLRYILSKPVLTGLIKMEIVFGLFSMNPVMITIIGREVLSVGPEGLGGLLSAPALGALLGIGTLLTVGHSQRQGRFVVMCTLLYSAALLAFMSSSEYPVSFAALALVGLCDSLITVTRQNIVHLASPGRMRGRVIGNFGTATRGSTPLGQVQSGFLAGAIGGPMAVLCAAAVLAISGVVGAWTNPALWRYRRDEAEPARMPMTTDAAREMVTDVPPDPT